VAIRRGVEIDDAGERLSAGQAGGDASQCVLRGRLGAALQRIRACYQHAGLKRVMTDFMTNQSLRERFKLPASKGAVVSQIIAATLDAGLVKVDESVGASLKLRRYLPYWA